MAIDLDRVQQTFFEEAPEHLGEMEAGLLQLEATPDDADLLNCIFRGAHSIKGASGLFGFTAISGLTHVLENLLDRLRTGQIQPERGLIDLLLRAVDALRGLVTSTRTGDSPPDGVTEVEHELRAVLGDEPAAPPVAPSLRLEAVPTGPRTYRVVIEPQLGLLREGLDPLLLLRNLARRGEVQAVVANLGGLPPLADLDPESCYLTWTVQLRSEHPPSELLEVFRFVEGCCLVRVDTLDDETPGPGSSFTQPGGLLLLARDILLAQADFEKSFARLAGAVSARRTQARLA